VTESTTETASPAPGTRAAQVLELFAIAGARTLRTDQIAASLQVTPGNASIIATTMVRRGWLVSPKRGRYALPEVSHAGA
jgi:DNA-binding IclR family transcriptional regulator